MVNQSIVVSSSWALLANNVDYMLQVTSGVLLVKASATTPVDAVGAFKLVKGDVLTSTMLSGVIYVSAPLGTQAYVTYAV